MRISDWSSDVCSSDLRPLRSFPIFPGRREHCPWPSIPRFRYPEPKERSLGWRLFQCCFLWRRSSVRKHWHGEPMAAVCVMSFEIEVRRRIRSEEHTSELQSLMRISYAVFCLNKKKKPSQ